MFCVFSSLLFTATMAARVLAHACIVVYAAAVAEWRHLSNGPFSGREGAMA